MSTVEKILRSIESLSQEEYARLREWFAERDWEKWDKQIETRRSYPGSPDSAFRK